MKQFAVIGLGSFGRRVIEEMLELNTEIIIIDKKEETINLFKDRVEAAYIADVSNEETINRLIPHDIDSVVIDLGDDLEVTILLTNYLKKMNVGNIVVKAETDMQGEVLEIIGADHVIYPDLEAARRVTPMLVSSSFFNYLPISSGLVMAEIRVPSKFVGKTLIEANLRQTEKVNIVAIKKSNKGEYSFFVPDYALEAEDVLLAVGDEKDIHKFSALHETVNTTRLPNFLKKILGN